MGLEPTCAYLCRSSSGLEAVSHYGNTQQVGQRGVEPRQLLLPKQAAYHQALCPLSSVHTYVVVFFILIIVSIIVITIVGIVSSRVETSHCYSIVHLDGGVRVVITRRAANPDEALTIFHKDHPDAKVLLVTRSWHKACAKADEKESEW